MEAGLFKTPTVYELSEMSWIAIPTVSSSLLRMRQAILSL